VTVLEARPLVSLLKYHELQGYFFFFVHTNDRGLLPSCDLPMSFVSCPSQVRFVINELVFFIIIRSEHHSSKWKYRRYTHVYAIELMSVFIHANINYTLHSNFLHKRDINYVFFQKSFFINTHALEHETGRTIVWCYFCYFVLCKREHLKQLWVLAIQ